MEHRDPQDFQDKLWKAIKDDRTVMLGLDGVEDGHTRPMTAQLDGDSGPAVWFFTSKENQLVRQLRDGSRATAAFASKGHELFASIEGALADDTGNREMIERLWNPFVAAWYEGKDDPKLALLRLEIDDAKIWLSDLGGFLKPAVNKLFGRKPEAGMKDKVAEVSY